MSKYTLLICLFLVSATYSSSNNCECGTSHVYNQYSNTCVKLPTPGQKDYVEGCKSYAVDGIHNQYWSCIACKPQYQLKKNNICQDTGIPGCESALYNRETKSYSCQVCDTDNYYLEGYSCHKFPSKGQRDYILGCKSYYSRNICQECDKGYTIKGTYCQKIQKLVPNCNTYLQNQQCFFCEADYTLNGKNQCVKAEDAIQNCKVAFYSSYSKQIICNECNTGYYVNQKLNKCYTNPTSNRDGYIPYCKQYHLSEKDILQCIKCDTDYSLKKFKNSSNCEKIEGNKINNCEAYVTNNQIQQQVCVKCLPGYISSESQYQIIQACKNCPGNPDQKLKEEEQLKVQVEEQGLEEIILNAINDIFNKFF